MKNYLKGKFDMQLYIASLLLCHCVDLESKKEIADIAINEKDSEKVIDNSKKSNRRCRDGFFPLYH